MISTTALPQVSSFSSSFFIFMAHGLEKGAASFHEPSKGYSLLIPFTYCLFLTP
ncbi:hypothetical protein ITX41_12130 [Enterococcus faecium]|uniref:hypothetical protein n=1 Tax=Enterococcus faecium TaxID=1352 RepID=UPI001CBEC6FA|nr:hypothetical protein [Enterococcus faecium]MBZ3655299.1 hypothetical protein [Enterococcus faecium]